MRDVGWIVANVGNIVVYYFLTETRLAICMAKWNKTAKWKRARIELLKARDGLLCWLCNRHLLKGGKRKNQQITIEHLVARSLGGGDNLENLALCHPGCNRQLADRSIEKKRQIRKKVHRETARRVAGSGVTE